MEVFGKDLRIGETFLLSSLGQMLGSFSASGEEEAELGYANETVEEFLGDNPVPVYQGSKYSDKLKLEIEIIKNPCVRDYSPYFSQHDLREVLRYLTGYQYYKELQIVDDDSQGENLYYYARFTSVSYEKVGGRVVGIILQGECDSWYAYTKEMTNSYKLTSDGTKNMYNLSDELYDYLYPVVTLVPDSAGTITITNQTDDNYETTIENVSAGETITMDCKRHILTSSIPDKVILNDFNMHWFRLLPGKNVVSLPANVAVTLIYRLPRKVGVE